MTPAAMIDMKEITKTSSTLTPFAFESMLFMTSAAQVAGQPFDDLSLSQIIDQAIEVEAPHKTFSLLSDLILTAVAYTSVASNDHAPVTVHKRPPMKIPVSTASTLLGKVITGLRAHPGYDISQASRWIRCVVQVVLDKHDETKEIQTHQDLSMADAIIHQALSLAHSTAVQAYLSHSQDEEASLMDEAAPSLRTAALYPAEEVEWLATTLFNLAIDLRIQLDELHDSPATGTTHNHNHHSNTAADLSHNPCPDMFETAPSNDNTDTEPAWLQPRYWASLALELADLLDVAKLTQVLHESAGQGTGSVDMSRHGYGDNGVLARVLRKRCAKLGWEV
jgi:hypothetical protein